MFKFVATTTLLIASFAGLPTLCVAKPSFPPSAIITPRIIDGTTAPVSQFPAVAKLILSNDGRCSGTLITPRHVLTAAHCFFDTLGNRVISNHGVQVSVANETVSSYRVYLHPTYTYNETFCVPERKDVAIIRLATRITATPFIPLDSLPLNVGEDITIAGFGLIGSGNTGQSSTLPADGTLEYGQTRVEDIQAATFSWTFDSGLGEANTAGGDSGGPALRQTLSEPSGYSLVGWTCGGEGNAEYGTLSVNYRADVFTTWATRVRRQDRSPPRVYSERDVSAQVGQLFNYDIISTSPFTLTYSAHGLPPGLTRTKNHITGLPEAAGDFTSTITVKAPGGTTQYQLTIHVLS